MSDAAPDPSPAPPEHRHSTLAEASLLRARKRRRLALLVPLGALLASLIIGEIVARISGARAVKGIVSAGERGWGPEPGRRDYDDIPATVTEFGTRGVEGKPGGILVVGDETVFGAGLRDEETIGAVLAAELKAHVTLAACEGYGAQQELLWIRELAPRLTPSGIVVIFAFDDPRPFAATLFTSLRFRLQSFSALAASAFPGARPATRAELHELYKPDEVPWRLFRQTIRELGEWSRKEKIPVLLAIWPFAAKQDEGLAEYFEQARGEARLNGVEVRNLADDLGADMETLRTKGGKWNSEAMKRAAKGIADGMKEGE